MAGGMGASVPHAAWWGARQGTALPCGATLPPAPGHTVPRHPQCHPHPADAARFLGHHHRCCCCCMPPPPPAAAACAAARPHAPSRPGAIPSPCPPSRSNTLLRARPLIQGACTRALASMSQAVSSMNLVRPSPWFHTRLRARMRRPCTRKDGGAGSEARVCVCAGPALPKGGRGEGGRGQGERHWGEGGQGERRWGGGG